MNIIDIIVVILLIYALWRGWSSGILVQLGGILGIIAGVWMACKFSEKICLLLGFGINYKWLIFIAIFAVVVIVVMMICRLLSSVLSAGGLSLPIKLLGAAASVIKIIIILALIIRTFEDFNVKAELVATTHLKESRSYKHLDSVASTVFPYLNEYIYGSRKDDSELEKKLEDKINKEIEKQVQKRLDSLQTKNNNE